jgi:hypothetical protein
MRCDEPGKPRGEERRSFFRIDDHVRLTLREVSAAELETVLDRLEQDIAGNFTVMSSLAAITAQMTMGLRRIENRDPDLAAYLRAIDQKIEVIGRAFIQQEPEFQAKHAVPVNLSAGGICVGVDQPYDIGTTLEIRMLLFPSFTGLLIFGTVVSIEEAPPDGYLEGCSHLARIEFSHIRESDRELLIRHLLRRQSLQIRDRADGRSD